MARLNGRRRQPRSRRRRQAHRPVQSHGIRGRWGKVRRKRRCDRGIFGESVARERRSAIAQRGAVGIPVRGKFTEAALYAESSVNPRPRKKKRHRPVRSHRIRGRRGIRRRAGCDRAIFVTPPAKEEAPSPNPEPSASAVAVAEAPATPSPTPHETPAPILAQKETIETTPRPTLSPQPSATSERRRARGEGTDIRTGGAHRQEEDDAEVRWADDDRGTDRKSSTRRRATSQTQPPPAAATVKQPPRQNFGDKVVRFLLYPFRHPKETPVNPAHGITPWQEVVSVRRRARLHRAGGRINHLAFSTSGGLVRQS